MSFVFKTQGEAAAYVAAMIEGEGHVGSVRRRSYQVTISNTSPFILNRCAEALDVLGVTYAGRGLHYVGKQKSGHSNMVLAIYSRGNFVRLLDACESFLASHKVDSLRALVNDISPVPQGRPCELGCGCGRHTVSAERRERSARAKREHWEAGVYDEIFKRRVSQP